MGKEPKGMYERLLAEAKEVRKTGGSKKTDSPVLANLLEKATPNRPEYASDLGSLQNLIVRGGSHNCGSSMWFRFLRDRYPGEYEELKTEHLGKGGSLREGFRHSREFAREELEHLDIKEDLVFCTELGEPGEYGWFMHEADILLWPLGNAVERGDLTLDQLREYWRPYQPRWDTLYEASLEEWEEHLWPSLSGDCDMPVTTDFEYEAHTLGRSDAGHLGSYSMSTGDIFEVRGAEALEALSKTMTGRYRIVLKEDLSDYDFSGSGSNPEEAIQFFERTLAGE